MQTEYNIVPPMGRPGMLADSRLVKHTQSKIASGYVKMGLGVFIVPGLNNGPDASPGVSPGRCYQNPVGGTAADVDAIHGATATTAGAGVTVLAANANGVIGASDIQPPRKLTAVLNSNANWDAGTLTYTYVNDDGDVIADVLAVPDGGNVTLTTTGNAGRFISAVFNAASASGTGGSFTLGVAAVDTSITAADYLGVALYDAATVESSRPLNTLGEYLDGATVGVLRVGAVWVDTEDACLEGTAVYVRIASGAGGSQLGAFRSDADTASAVLVPNARWGRNSLAAGRNILESYT